MNRTRWIATGVVVAVLAASGAAYGLARDGGGRAATAAPVGTAAPSTTGAPTTIEAPTTSTSTTTTVPPTTTTVDDGVLRSGSRGAEVQRVQERLRALHYDPGAADGVFGQATVHAVQAFQKLNGMAPDGRVGPQVLAALEHPAPIAPLVPDGGENRVEVDLRRQVLLLYRDGELRLISHVSTGSGERYCVEGSCDNRAITPIGSHRFSWRYSGWRQSRLGKLYNPVYFTGSGVAVHGALSVPTYPASHGCVRIPMHIAEYFPSLVRRGDAVYVTDGRPLAPAKGTPSGPPPSDPPTTPGDDGATTTTTAPPTSTSEPGSSTTSPSTTSPSTTSPSSTSPSTTTTTPTTSSSAPIVTVAS